MTVRQPRYSGDEHARRGSELYERQVRPLVEGNTGKIVAIDLESGELEMADRVLPATDRLLARLPDAQVWCERIGHEAVYRFRSPLLSSRRRS